MQVVTEDLCCDELGMSRTLGLDELPLIGYVANRIIEMLRKLGHLVNQLVSLCHNQFNGLSD